MLNKTCSMKSNMFCSLVSAPPFNQKKMFALNLSEQKFEINLEGKQPVKAIKEQILTNDLYKNKEIHLYFNEKELKDEEEFDLSQVTDMQNNPLIIVSEDEFSPKLLLKENSFDMLEYPLSQFSFEAINYKQKTTQKNKQRKHRFNILKYPENENYTETLIIKPTHVDQTKDITTDDKYEKTIIPNILVDNMAPAPIFRPLKKGIKVDVRDEIPVLSDIAGRDVGRIIRREEINAVEDEQQQENQQNNDNNAAQDGNNNNQNPPNQEGVADQQNQNENLQNENQNENENQQNQNGEQNPQEEQQIPQVEQPQQQEENQIIADNQNENQQQQENPNIEIEQQENQNIEIEQQQGNENQAENEIENQIQDDNAQQEEQNGLQDEINEIIQQLQNENQQNQNNEENNEIENQQNPIPNEEGNAEAANNENDQQQNQNQDQETIQRRAGLLFQFLNLFAGGGGANNQEATENHEENTTENEDEDNKHNEEEELGKGEYNLYIPDDSDVLDNNNEYYSDEYEEETNEKLPNTEDEILPVEKVHKHKRHRIKSKEEREKEEKEKQERIKKEKEAAMQRTAKLLAEAQFMEEEDAFDDKGNPRPGRIRRVKLLRQKIDFSRRNEMTYPPVLYSGKYNNKQRHELTNLSKIGFDMSLVIEKYEENGRDEDKTRIALINLL